MKSAWILENALRPAQMSNSCSKELFGTFVSRSLDDVALEELYDALESQQNKASKLESPAHYFTYVVKTMDNLPFKEHDGITLRTLCILLQTVHKKTLEELSVEEKTSRILIKQLDSITKEAI
ncbi:hypothetical protein RJF_2683 [Candidozyma auris]|nr:hypothetical protein QG37_04969 [[Candida] auris]GBL52425.1 hypothetical protein CAJCM15448_46990 [[Candida] auris]